MSLDKYGVINDSGAKLKNRRTSSTFSDLKKIKKDLMKSDDECDELVDKFDIKKDKKSSSKHLPKKKHRVELSKSDEEFERLEFTKGKHKKSSSQELSEEFEELESKSISDSDEYEEESEEDSEESIEESVEDEHMEKEENKKRKNIDHIVDKLLKDIEAKNNDYGTLEIYDGKKEKKTIKEIPREKHTQFWLGLCDIVEDNPDVDYGMGEMPRETMPVTIRFNCAFEGNIKKKERVITENTPFELVYLVQTQLYENYIFSEETDNSALCVVLMGEMRYDKKNNQSVIEIRLHFPKCRVETDYFVKKILPIIIDYLSREAQHGSNLFRNGKVMQEDWKDIIDMSIYTNSIPLYGSRDSNDIKAPLFLMVVNDIISTDDEFNVAEFLVDIHEVLKPIDHSKISQDIIDEKKITNYMEIKDQDYWLPLYLSMDYWSTQTMPAEKKNLAKKIVEARETKYDMQEFMNKLDVDDYTDIEMAKIFIGMWDPARVVDSKCWKLIGEAYYDIAEGSQAGLNSWVNTIRTNIKKLSRVPLFLQGNIRKACENVYETFRIKKVTIKTLAWYAREDNPTAYEEWHDAWCKKAMVQATSHTHTDVARVLYRKYWLTHLCTHEGEKVIWYKFDGSKLKIDPGGFTLKTLMCKDMVAAFLKMRLHIMAQQSTHNQFIQDVGETILVKLIKLIDLLKDHNFKNVIVKEAAIFFMHEDLSSLLNENPELLGTTNGVICATDEDIDFRAGKPEDYITRSTKVPYRKDYSWDHTSVYAVLMWSRKTFTDENLYLFFWKFMASLLRGGNNDKKFLAFTGENGDNSKSTWIKAIEAVLGPYCIKMPMAMVTGHRGDANAPSPAMYRSKATRLMVLEEPEDNTPIQGGIIKYITGSDSSYQRTLHKEGEEIIPLYKVILVCNAIPEFQGGGKALRNRFIAVPFLSRWVNDPPDDVEEQFKIGRFKIDPFFDKKIPPLATAIFWIQVNYYMTYLSEKLSVPEIITNVTQDYWDKKDKYFMFSAEVLETAKPEDKTDPDAKIEINALYKLYKLWQIGAFPKAELPIKPTFITEISRRWDNPEDGYWMGKRLREKFLSGDATF